MVEEREHHYAQVNEMKGKSIDSTFEKKTQEKGRGTVIYQSQTAQSGSQVRGKKQRRNAPSSLAGFGPGRNTATSVYE